MSKAAPDDYGPAQARVSPPIDAVATVAVDDDPVTKLPVPESSTLRIHAKNRSQTDEWEDYEDAEIPDPAGEVPDDAHASVETRTDAWITVTVEDDRKCQVGVTERSLVTVHLTEADLDDEVFDG